MGIATLLTGLLHLTAAMAPQAIPHEQGVRWCGDAFAQGLVRAEREQRPALVYFWMEGSDHCDRMLQTTLGDPTVLQEVEPYLCLRVDIGAAESASLVQQYHITVVPTVLVLTQEGAVDDAVVGFVPAPELLTQIRRIKKGVNTISALKQRIEKNPKDLQARLDLAKKLQYAGDAAGFAELLDSIRAADPKGRTVVGAQLIFRDLAQSLLDAADAETPPQAVDLTPAYEYVNKVRHEVVAFEGWQWIADMEASADRMPESRQALVKSWSRVPDDQRQGWGSILVRRLFEDRADLAAQDRRFALKVATGLVKEAESNHRKNGGGANLDRQLAEAHTAMACAYSMAGQRSKAMKSMTEALTLSPGNEEIEFLQQQISAEPAK